MTYIVAEISASHNGSIEIAYELIRAAKDCGADAVKLQTYLPETIAANPEYIITNGSWVGLSLRELYQQAHTPREWHGELFHYADEIGIDIFSTPFQVEDVEFLEAVGCEKYKISSFEIINYDLVSRVAATGKPVIMSTGMATEDEIKLACQEARISGCKDLTLLHCVSSYPTELNKVNLKTMHDLRQFSGKIGLSDHSLGSIVPMTATAMGADVIEKHIGLDRSGPDGGFLMMPGEFKQMVELVRQVEKVVGSVVYAQDTGLSPLRPSIYYSEDLEVGTVINRCHVKVGRPAEGLHPRHLYSLIGKQLSKPVKQNQPVSESDYGSHYL